MTQLLKKAVKEISRLSAAEQNAVASLILDEITDKKKWDDSFAKSQNQLEYLAEEALKEFNTGKTQPLKF